jgi:molybdopterin converting factor small subunit
MLVTVTLLFHAAVRDRLALSQVAHFTLSSDWNSAADLLSHLCGQEFPALSDLRPILILAINEQYCSHTDPITLSSGDRIALIPPITGG